MNKITPTFRIKPIIRMQFTNTRVRNFSSMRLRSRMGAQKTAIHQKAGKKITKNKAQLAKTRKSLKLPSSASKGLVLNAEANDAVTKRKIVKLEKSEVQAECPWFTKMDEEDHESTFFCSDYKETPKLDNLRAQAGYNLRLRSTKAAGNNDMSRRTLNQSNVHHFENMLELNKPRAKQPRITYIKAND